MPTGLILLAHGARDPRWREPFERLLILVAARLPDASVRLAFLEWMTPDLVAAGQGLVAEGCDALFVVPVFFGQGGHVREDVPKLIESLRGHVSGVTVTQGRTPGEDELILEALAAFCAQAVG